MEGQSKRRKLTRRSGVFAIPDRTQVQDTIGSDSPRTPVLRSRPSRLVIHSSSPLTTEIQETQQPSLSTTDSIQVNVPLIPPSHREEYQTLPDSSAGLPLPESNQTSSGTSKDQEADSALGLSSPIDDIRARTVATRSDQRPQSTGVTLSTISSNSTIQDIAPSAEIARSQSSTRHPRTRSGLRSSLLVDRSDPIETTPEARSGRLRTSNQSVANSATSSPLFCPDPREIGNDLAASGDSLETNQILENSQIDSSAQLQVDNTENSQSSTDLVPIPSSLPESQDPPPRSLSQGQEQSAKPNGVAREFTVPKSVSPTPVAAQQNSLESSVESTQSAKNTLDFKKPPLTPPTKQAPRAKPFQQLNLRDKPQPSQRLLESMSSESRESSPRIRRAPPPQGERATPGSNLRETLIKQTAPARALQQARHDRSANRSSTRGHSTATNPSPVPIAPRLDMSGPGYSMRSVNASLQSPAMMNGYSSSAIQYNEPEPALVSTITPTASVYTHGLGSSALPVQASIEDDQPLPEVRKPNLPSNPCLGPAEYMVPLPAEGKIRAHYLECIRGKRRALDRFMRNYKPVGRANNSRTHVSCLLV